jgi:hypothetical protein
MNNVDSESNDIRYLYSPIAQAVWGYFIFVFILFLYPVKEESVGPTFVVSLIVLGMYSITGPVVNISSKNWWVDTFLFLVSWALLELALESTHDLRFKSIGGIGAAGLATILPMYICGFVFPLTAFTRWSREKASKSGNEAK